MIEYLRPSGTTITVSDNVDNRAYAAANGWTEVKPKISEAVKKPAKKSK